MKIVEVDKNSYAVVVRDNLYIEISFDIVNFVDDNHYTLCKMDSNSYLLNIIIHNVFSIYLNSIFTE